MAHGLSLRRRIGAILPPGVTTESNANAGTPDQVRYRDRHRARGHCSPLPRRLQRGRRTGCPAVDRTREHRPLPLRSHAAGHRGHDPAGGDRRGRGRSQGWGHLLHMGIERPLGGNGGLGGCRAGGRKGTRDDHRGGGFDLGDRPGDRPRTRTLRRHASARGSHARGAGDHGLPGLGRVVRGRLLLLQQRLEPAGHERLRAVHHAADTARAGREGGIRLAMALADEEGAGQSLSGADLRAQTLASTVDHAGASSTHRRHRSPRGRLRGLSRRRGHVQPRVRLLDHARRSAQRVRHLTRSDDLAGS